MADAARVLLPVPSAARYDPGLDVKVYLGCYLLKATLVIFGSPTDSIEIQPQERCRLEYIAPATPWAGEALHLSCREGTVWRRIQNDRQLLGDLWSCPAGTGPEVFFSGEPADGPP